MKPGKLYRYIFKCPTYYCPPFLYIGKGYIPVKHNEIILFVSFDESAKWYQSAVIAVSPDGRLIKMREDTLMKDFEEIEIKNNVYSN